MQRSKDPIGRTVIGELDVQPSQRIDRQPISLIDDHRSRFSLDDGSAFERLPRGKRFKRIDRNFQPFSEERRTRAWRRECGGRWSHILS